MTAQQPAVMSEAQLQEGLLACARQLGFLAWHATVAQRSEPGFPDVLCVGHGAVLIFEVKSQRGRLRPGSWTKKGRWMPGQRQWLEAFQEAGVYAAVVRPTGTRDAISYDEALGLIQQAARQEQAL